MRKRKEQYEILNGLVDFENVRRSSRKKLKKKDRATIQRIRQERKRILAALGKKDTQIPMRIIEEWDKAPLVPQCKFTVLVF